VCGDGTAVYPTKTDIGTGMFQVQIRRANDPMVFRDDPGPWSIEKRFGSLSEAEDYCRKAPTNWTERQIFVDPKELSSWLN
jgi:hypothetical protein